MVDATENVESRPERKGKLNQTQIMSDLAREKKKKKRWNERKKEGKSVGQTSPEPDQAGPRRPEKKKGTWGTTGYPKEKKRRKRRGNTEEVAPPNTKSLLILGGNEEDVWERTVKVGSNSNGGRR